MGKTKVISFIAGLAIIVVMGGYFIYFSPLSSRSQTTFDLNFYPNAKLIEKIDAPTNVDIGKVTLHSGDPVPTVVRWYLSNLPRTDWNLDVAPGDLNNPELQFMRLAKGDLRLSISLKSDGQNGTDIYLEEVNRAQFDEE